MTKELGILEDLVNIKTSKAQFKQIVKSAIDKKNEDILREEIRKYSKLKDWEDDDYERKNYLKVLTLEEARMKFRIRTNMTECAFNFKNKPEYSNNNWFCPSCNVAIETFSHIKWCESYAELRFGKDLEDDKDLVSYIFEVMKKRASKENVPLLSVPNGL